MENFNIEIMDPIAVFNQSPIKGTFVVHFMLINCALNILSWMPTVYLMYNVMFFLCLFWSLHSATNPEPVQLAAIINVVSILLDIMAISTNYHAHNYLAWFGFSLFLIIVNLMLRPITTIILFRVYNQRNTGFNSYHNIGDELNHPPVHQTRPSEDRFGNRNGYENIDPPTRPTMAGGTLPYQSVPSPVQSPLIETK